MEHNHVGHENLHAAHAPAPMGHDMHGMHSMAFHFGSSEMILFNFWDVSTPIGLIISCLVVFVGCVVYEGLRWVRLHRKATRALIESQVPLTGRRRLDPALAVDAVIHAAQLFLGYCAMLVFMTFNVWLCLFVVLGEVVAHLLFRLFFPQLDNASFTSTSDPCCG